MVRAADVWAAVKTTFLEWRLDKAQRLSAAIAFYTVFSLAPLLVIAIAVAGRLFGQEAVRGEIVAQFAALIGVDAAKQIETMIVKAVSPTTSLVASMLGVIGLFLGATGVFGQLKDALNTIWGAVPPRRGSVRRYLRDRALALAMVMGISFLLLVSLLISAALSAVTKWASEFVPRQLVDSIQAVHFVLSFALITVLFAMIYKILPDVRIAWRDVWIGAAVTSFLFNAGKYLIGLYLGRASVGSIYGAAGSLIILLVWIYYSTSIFLFGAEFTQVFARRWGSRIVSRGIHAYAGAAAASASAPPAPPSPPSSGSAGDSANAAAGGPGSAAAGSDARPAGRRAL